jgi:hypothetical protein
MNKFIFSGICIFLYLSAYLWDSVDFSVVTARSMLALLMVLQDAGVDTTLCSAAKPCKPAAWIGAG